MVRKFASVILVERRAKSIEAFFSINVQIVCDSRCRITDAVARWPGSTDDGRILNNSRICGLLENGEYEGHLLRDCPIFADTVISDLLQKSE